MSQWNLEHPAMCACSQCRYAQSMHDFTERVRALKGVNVPLHHEAPAARMTADEKERIRRNLRKFQQHEAASVLAVADRLLRELDAVTRERDELRELRRPNANRD